MSAENSPLKEKSTLFIFAYSPTGFGHLRVTDALYHGLPSHVKPLLMGSQDELVRFLYRFLSIHPLARQMMEFSQQGWAEDAYARMFRFVLHRRIKNLYRQLTTLIEEQYAPPEKILVVATHFGLAHQLGAIKKRLEEERQIKLTLIVQVTDDTPQHIWLIPEADLIFVPSQKTKEGLEAYGRQTGRPVPKILVSAYPVSPQLSSKLSYYDFRSRLSQLDEASSTPIHVAIPISGAAVGMAYFTKLMDELHGFSKRFVFHVVTKITPNTMYFLNQMLSRSYVRVTASKSDREVVHAYEKLYHQKVIALEVTKPSEQAFKVLLKPKQKGGSIILFSDPVGRQEYDNLSFLRRHHLIPLPPDRDFLIKMAGQKKRLTLTDKKLFFTVAQRWRGIEIPKDPKEAASFIWWSVREEIFAQMARYSGPVMRTAQDRIELSSRGVAEFWEEVTKQLENDL